MTKLRVACLAGLLLSFIVPGDAVAQASIRDGALQDWIALKDTMMKIADAMPEDKFAYRATPAERTWGEQILHVAEANVAERHHSAGQPAVLTSRCSEFPPVTVSDLGTQVTLAHVSGAVTKR